MYPIVVVQVRLTPEVLGIKIYFRLRGNVPMWKRLTLKGEIDGA